MFHSGSGIEEEIGGKHMNDVKRELTKEEYEKGKINPYYLISDNIKMGYGAYGAEVHEEDGKYYLTFSMGDSCD